MANLNAKEYQRFEDIKHTTDEGMEFWYARELSQVLEYTEWRNFNKVIDKAMLACKNSGFAVSDHFVDINKMVYYLICSSFLSCHNMICIYKLSFY